MRRVVLLLGVSCLVVVCYLGTYLAFRPPIEPLLPSDATDIRVDAVSWWKWTLTYRALGPDYAWYFTVTHQLEASGWASEEQHTGGPLPDHGTYRRTTSFGFIALCERVELYGDLHVAHARMRRWVALALP